MPRTWLTRAFVGKPIQVQASLTRLFGVSWQSLRIRYRELGLTPDSAFDERELEAA